MLKEVHFIPVPIGDLKDISVKALEVLKASQIIILEDYRSGKKILNLLGIDLEAIDVHEINEHNEKKLAPSLVEELITKNKIVSLISDSGYPAIADSGHIFLKECLKFNIKINYYGGPSSILAGLLLSGFSLKSFYFAGFLDRQSRERERQLQSLKQMNTTVVLLETPYRLRPLLVDLAKVWKNTLSLSICFNISLPDEEIFGGTLREAKQLYGEKKLNKNFVMVLDLNNYR